MLRQDRERYVLGEHHLKGVVKVANKAEKEFKESKVKDFSLDSRLQCLDCILYLMETHQSFSSEY